MVTRKAVTISEVTMTNVATKIMNDLGAVQRVTEMWMKTISELREAFI